MAKDFPSVEMQVRGRIGIVTEQEMADILLLGSVDTLATWRSQKRGPPYVKLGKRIFYIVNDFGEWIVQEAQRQQASRPPATSKAAAESVAE